MSEDVRLQDYLDGRLSAAEREEFERLLERDPELRRRVETYRWIGDALRDQPAELPAGFHARARARFEQTRRPPQWLRPLSWEAVGLATAALLVAALFLPPWFRQDAPGVNGREPVGASRAPLGEDLADERADVPGPVREQEESPAAGEEPSSPRQSRPPSADDERARLRSKRFLADSLEAEKKEAARPPAASGKAGAEEQRRDVFAPQPNLPAEPAPRAEPVPEPFDEDASAQRVEGGVREWNELAEAEARPAEPASPQVTPAPAAPPAGADAPDAALKSEAEPRRFVQYAAPSSATVPDLPRPAPVGLLEPGETRVIATREDWLALIASESGRKLAGIDPDFGAARVVLVGPRARSLDCGATRVVAGDTVRILLAAASAGTLDSARGCVVVVPAGPAPVEIVEAW